MKSLDERIQEIADLQGAYNENPSRELLERIDEKTGLAKCYWLAENATDVPQDNLKIFIEVLDELDSKMNH